MSIFLRGKSWYYDFWVKGRRYVGCIGPVSKTLAKEFETRKKSEALQGILGIKTGKTKDPDFADFAQEFLEHYRLTRRASSGVSCASHIKHYIKHFERRRLSEITPKDVEKFKADQLSDGKAPASVNRYLVVLSQMFATAMLWGQATANPVQEVDLLRVRNGRTRFLSDEEEKILLRACGPNLRAVVIAGLHTGFRREELAKLTWRDVDFTRGIVRVPAERSKSGEGREVLMDRTLTGLLKDLRPDIINPSEPVFKNRFGNAFRRLSSLFAQVLGKTELRNLRFHDLRHTFASRLVMRGSDLRTVQELMGHHDIRMTERYAHLSDSHKRDAVYLLDRESQQFSQQSTVEGR